MTSILAKVLMAILALTGVAWAGAQSIDPMAGRSHAGQAAATLDLASVDISQLSLGTHAGVVTVSSVSSLPRYVFEYPSRPQHLASEKSEFTGDEWILVAIGAFLISAMWHRRLRSLVD